MATILLIASPGGHLFQLKTLYDHLFSEYDCAWVSLRKADSIGMIGQYKTYWGYGPTNRNFLNLFKNFILAIKILTEVKPKVIVSTGAGLAVPFFPLARLFGIKAIYIESFARKNNISLSGKLIKCFASCFLVQSERLADSKRNIYYLGTIY